MNYQIKTLYNNDTINLGVRTYNILVRSGFTDFRELLNVNFETFLNMKNASIRTVEQIGKALLKLFNNDTILKACKNYQKNKVINDILSAIIQKNNNINNRKVNLIINLVNNSGATIGEQKNGLLIAAKILGMNYEINVIENNL